MICKNCKLDLSSNSFYNQSNISKKYINTWKCKKCRVDYESARRLHPNYKVRKKLNRILNKYDITLNQYNDFIQKFEDNCVLCNILGITSPKSLKIDHDHKTGIIRGLLCNRHNTALGLIKDNILTLEYMKKYLRDHDISR